MQVNGAGVRFSSIGLAIIVIAFAAPAAGQGTCSRCRVCPGDPEQGAFWDSEVSTDPELWQGDLSNWGCFGDTCDAEHIPCGIYHDDDEEEVTQLAIAFDDVPRSLLAAFVARHKGTVRFVESRRAVQVASCSGAVAEHIPADVFRALIASPVYARDVDAWYGRSAGLRSRSGIVFASNSLTSRSVRS